MRSPSSLRRTVAATALTAAVLTPALTPGPAAAATPALDLPFRCGETVLGKAFAGHNPAKAIDFNGPGGGDTDRGMAIVAAGSGTVTISRYSTTSGYGHMIEIQHPGGLRSFYAHLLNRRVSVGEHVNRGQLIGQLGDSSATANISSHLHYEHRKDDGTVIRVRIRGDLAPEYDRMGESVRHTSHNNCS